MTEPGEVQLHQQQIIQKEILLNNGEAIRLPTINVTRMTLYHGSSVSGITAFQEGDQQTIGRGIYLTTDIEPAKGYARKRSNGAEDSRAYEVEVASMEVADLRTKSAQEQFAKLFKQKLLDWQENILPNMKGPAELLEIIKQQRREAIVDIIGKIDSNSFRQLRDLTFGWADLTTKTLQEQGYKGLMSIEGEPPAIDYHDSVVIFNPADLTMLQEKAA